MSISPPNIAKLQRRIGYHFNDESLLTLALTHRSYGSCNNERLEFLGDSLLNCTIAGLLFQQFEKAKEGQLSRLRSQMVKGETLADIAREFVLSDYLIMGEGELKSGGFRRDSILADTVEAIIGAIYLDNGMSECQTMIAQWYQARLQRLSLDEPQKDPKTQLQEYLQARQQPLPIYSVTNISGESHQQTFIIACEVSLLPKPVEASGLNRRSAEKLAAKKVLQQLGEIN